MQNIDGYFKWFKRIFVFWIIFWAIFMVVALGLLGWFGYEAFKYFNKNGMPQGIPIVVTDETK